MFTLYQFEASPFCDKIRRVLHWKKQPYEVHEVSLWQALTQVRRLNPVGKLPCLEHDGRFLADSSDIALYLEERFPTPPLLPHGPAQRAACHVLEDWADESLYFYEMRLRFGTKENARRWLPLLASHDAAPFRALATRILPRLFASQLRQQGSAASPSRRCSRISSATWERWRACSRATSSCVGDALTLADISVFVQFFCIRSTDEGAAAIEKQPARGELDESRRRGDGALARIASGAAARGVAGVVEPKPARAERALAAFGEGELARRRDLDAERARGLARVDLDRDGERRVRPAEHETVSSRVALSAEQLLPLAPRLRLARRAQPHAADVRALARRLGRGGKRRRDPLLGLELGMRFRELHDDSLRPLRVQEGLLPRRVQLAHADDGIVEARGALDRGAQVRHLEGHVVDAGTARGEKAVQEAVRRAIGLEHLDQSAARERELPEAEAQAGAGCERRAAELADEPRHRVGRARNADRDVIEARRVAQSISPARRLAASASIASMRRTAERISSAKARRRSARSGGPGSSRPRLRASRSRRLEQHLRDRGRAVHAPLQVILAAEPQALRSEARSSNRPRGIAPLEVVAHDLVGLEEGPQDAVRAERAEAAQQLLDRLARRRELALPVADR